MAHQLEALVVQQMCDIAAGAGEEIVDAQHFMAARQQRLAQVRAEKARAAGDQNALSQIRPLIKPLFEFVKDIIRGNPDNALTR